MLLCSTYVAVDGIVHAGADERCSEYHGQYVDVPEEDHQCRSCAADGDGQAQEEQPQDVEVAAQKIEHDEDKHHRDNGDDGHLTLCAGCAFIAVEGKAAEADLDIRELGFNGLT